MLVTAVSCSATRPAKDPPNILLIVSDDQRNDTMQFMPRTQSLIFDQGVTFDEAYVTTSRCCPSRSSILTGMFAHNHEVILNSDPLTKKTMVEYLKENGYYTGLVGKYLNSYPTSPQDPPRPEFDSWIGMISGPDGSRYFDTSLNVNGRWTEHSGYQTYILRDYAIDFLQQAKEQPDPFFLLYAPYAPHLPAVPAPGDEQLYADLPPHNPPNFNPEDMSGKPEWMQSLPFLTDDQIASIQRDWLHQNQTLNALDESIESLIQELDHLDMLDNTIIIYLSDNGMFLGEQRFPIGKIYVYEESMRVPFAVRYAQMIEKPRVESRLVGNIDIAPTLYELAGIPIPEEVDGLSLVSLLRDQPFAKWREHLLLEGWPFGVAYVENSPPFQAIRSGDYVYVETEGDISELYDLQNDPYQLHNQINNPDYDKVVAGLQKKLAQERETIPSGHEG
jgi:arylsulfatase A-like enzyme